MRNFTVSRRFLARNRFRVAINQFSGSQTAWIGVGTCENRFATVFVLVLLILLVLFFYPFSCYCFFRLPGSFWSFCSSWSTYSFCPFRPSYFCSSRSSYSSCWVCYVRFCLQFLLCYSFSFTPLARLAVLVTLVWFAPFISARPALTTFILLSNSCFPHLNSHASAYLAPSIHSAEPASPARLFLLFLLLFLSSCFVFLFQSSFCSCSSICCCFSVYIYLFPFCHACSVVLHLYMYLAHVAVLVLFCSRLFILLIFILILFLLVLVCSFCFCSSPFCLLSA